MQRPEGPFRLLAGDEYAAARKAADKDIRMIRKFVPEMKNAGGEIHEIKPVKFDGNPTDPKNKVLLGQKHHDEFIAWWNTSLRKMKQKP